MNRIDHDRLIAELSAIPEARRVIEQYKANRRRGREPKNDLQFRRLSSWWDKWWKPFHAKFPEIPRAVARGMFWRAEARRIEKLLDINRHTPESRRKAITRGKIIQRKVLKRRAVWQIVPTGLVGAIHGRFYRIATDPNEAVLLRDAIRRAYLGE